MIKCTEAGSCWGCKCKGVRPGEDQRAERDTPHVPKHALWVACGHGADSRVALRRVSCTCKVDEEYIRTKEETAHPPGKRSRQPLAPLYSSQSVVVACGTALVLLRWEISWLRFKESPCYSITNGLLAQGSSAHVWRVSACSVLLEPSPLH